MNQRQKLIGSTLIIAGTTIGAGMLALPIASAGLGFTSSTIMMIAIWALMAYTAILMLEVHQHADNTATLHTLAQQFLGNNGKRIATFAMLFLFYALCAAYIAGGGGQLAARVNHHSDIAVTAQQGSVILTLFVAAIVATGVKQADITNRILFAIKLVLLVVTFKLLAPQVETSNLLQSPSDNLLLLSALPVVFTSFGFHGSIPSVVRYLDLPPMKLKKVMVIGSALPLLIYLIWQWTTQGTLSSEQISHSGELDSFLNLLATHSHSGWLMPALRSFAELALLTSFLGVALGLFDFIRDMIGQGSRLLTALITFLPPLGFALFYPQGFITALGYAALALVVLAIFLPVGMAHRARKMQPEIASNSIGLIMAAACGVLIVTAQVAQMVGLLPAVG
ncbi:aromatic amino acid transport family protein [Thaumasiovibrio subtropicus]|uniref:aromatic amino acid transport family protein n=1 Tax=Thaumasiovibrio subtropicus TaxID=1891207 RepID=UPI000B34C411|nr:aromatic amino acid transport family protein [Thaumasiovibrio subtropicus]